MDKRGVKWWAVENHGMAGESEVLISAEMLASERSIDKK